MSPDEIIAYAVRYGCCDVPLGYAPPHAVESRRKELHEAALRQAEPIEIVTLPMGHVGEVGPQVRKFASPPLGTCDGHRCMPQLPCSQPHVRYYDCQNWVKA